ncbi:hypothetical protein T459_24081 [Capsicum annuum]|uniref:Uncharacterized protein n=1 Tax=Capsicum annuum TaxID=4072 RepID=A0A2G2YU80_CAPAN|nr:hypothetical protein T459_24081 [Capsicum annuum]
MKNPSKLGRRAEGTRHSFNSGSMRFGVTVLVKAKLHRSLKGELKEQDAQLRQNVISSDRPDEGQIDVLDSEKRRLLNLNPAARNSLVVVDDTYDVLKIKRNKIFKNNSRFRLDNVVSVHQCPDVKYGIRIHLLPIDDTIKGVTRNLVDAYLSLEACAL